MLPYDCPRCGYYVDSDNPNESFIARSDFCVGYNWEFGCKSAGWTVEILCPKCSMVYSYCDGYP